MSISDLAARLDDILAAIREIETFVAGKAFDDYMADAMLRRAVERDVEIISEASRYIPEGLKARHPTIPWRKVAGVGNVLRHGYKLIDDHETWDIVTHDLAPLKATVESMLLEVDGGRDAE
jgi:uncharacterized protein with HEPN domain